MIQVLSQYHRLCVRHIVKVNFYDQIPVQVCKSIFYLPFVVNFYYLGDDRIIVFASNEQLSILRSARHFMSDGTFKVVPEIFYQLYIIHAVYRDHVLPLCYALLRRKDASTYDRLFNEILKFVPEWAPDSMMIDYEKACINSYHSVFPNAELSGCYFHLKQNLHRKLQVSIFMHSDPFPIVFNLVLRLSNSLSN